MLQFWKKGGAIIGRGNQMRSTFQGSRTNSTESTSSQNQQTLNGVMTPGSANDEPGSVGPLRGFHDGDFIEGDLGSPENKDQNHRHKSSKLSKTLSEVLSDKGALGYFIQYMESRQKTGYIRFWLDAESFSAATKCLKLSPAEDSQEPSVPWAIRKDWLESSTGTNDSASIVSTEDGSLSPTVDITSRTDMYIFHNEFNSSAKVQKVNENDTHDETLVCSRADSLFRDALMDAVQIYQKYLSVNVPLKQLVQVPEALRFSIIDQICREDGRVNSECFAQAQQYVYETMDKEFFNDFLRSDFHCKHQIDVLTSGNVTLCDILFNETALFHFTEFMEQEGKQNLLEFWLAATNFQQQLLEKAGVYDTMEAQNDAIVLYDKYFSLQATSPLGFSDKVRFDVEQKICREEGPLPDCFEQAAKIVLHVLNKNYFQLFLSSQLYLKYLSELINTIQNSHSLLARRRSDCSSEHSLSSLATQSEDFCAPRKVIHNIDEREMSIDSRQLYDPDSLWRRRHQSGLSCGRINELGRFETDFEPEPDKKGESRLTRVVKKFVNLEEDKAKEEMAWQIAAMIVKDVTSITLGQRDATTSTTCNVTDKKEPLGS